MPSRQFVALITCALLAACASRPSSSPIPASEVQLYNSTQLIPSQYAVVERIWIDTSGSAFGYPSFDAPDAAIQAMKEEAGEIGAPAILNVMCMDGSGWRNGQQLCYGDAIKFK